MICKESKKQDPVEEQQDAVLAGLRDHLERLSIPWTLHRHQPFFTVEDARSLRGSLPGFHTKNLFLSDKRGLYVLVTAEETTKIHLADLARFLGAKRFSFGKARDLEALLRVKPGSVTPLALTRAYCGQIRIILDQRLAGNRAEEALINVHPLRNDCTLTLSFSDLVRFLVDLGYDPLICDLEGLKGS